MGRKGREKGPNMLINDNRNPQPENRVEFVSYDGKTPNLCRGVLVLRIDGKEIRFNDRNSKTYKLKKGSYPRFWETGGECYFAGDYTNPIVTGGEWMIDVEDLPEKFRELADKIDAVFNANVEHGCCGGCI